MGVDERGIHRYLHFALKVHQIDAFNFNIKKKIFLEEHPPLKTSVAVEHSTVATNTLMGIPKCLSTLYETSSYPTAPPK